ncbi:MAG: hypothetical protein H8E32_05485 [Nitrospinae bacterium]|nr:hypothetical protein [Nitrospinota bacterium]
MFKIVRHSCRVIFLLIMIGPSAHASEPVHHQLKIDYEPSTAMMRVQDEVTIKTTDTPCDSYSFYLDAGMKLKGKEVSNGWIISMESQVVEKPQLQKIVIQKKTEENCSGELSFTLDYSGLLIHPLESTEDSSKFEGFIFSSADYFYPVQISSNSTLTFDMQVSLPEPWQSVSQGEWGKLKSEPGRRVARWNSELPSEEIFLIGNRFKVYEEKYRSISLFAFLLQDEPSLAAKYIRTAKSYIDFYSKLLGSYPYTKFALVENPKQTGYGMPSFTLMGSRIIRFPFILHSSYPHEILHNWWGNGVFADAGSGNWSEGLTAYLADHLLLELKGKGSQYRFQEMLKYLSYVNDTNEFPIKDFSHRESMASQAIGYGKLLMVFHMLRTELGDKTFLQGLKKYYEKFKYRYAGFGEMQDTFEAISGEKLDWFFEQWVERKGAPEFELADASYVSTQGRYDLLIDVKQTTPYYRLKLPVAIWKEGSSLPEIHYLNLDQSRQKFHLNISRKPKAVRLDPYNEVFRKLNGKEVPASIGQTFGAPEARIVFPAMETEVLLQGYRQLGNSMRDADNIKKPFLNDLKDDFPADISLWVLGKNNEVGKDLLPDLKKLGINLKDDSFVLKEGIFFLKNHSFVFTLPRSENGKSNITWIIASSEASIPGLIRKLPHYGKYGYLVFKGREPVNVVKGSWTSNPASLQKIFSDGNFLLPSQSSLINFQPSNPN